MTREKSTIEKIEVDRYTNFGDGYDGLTAHGYAHLSCGYKVEWSKYMWNGVNTNYDTVGRYDARIYQPLPCEIHEAVHYHLVDKLDKGEFELTEVDD